MKKNSVQDWKEAILSGIRGEIQNISVNNAEKKTGCDFGGRISKTELGYGTGEGYDYTPSFDHIRGFCGNQNSVNDKSIMDLGCGKGYAMYLMSRYPFKHIYGVEKDSKLAEIAKTNCERLDQNARFQVLASDAIDIDANLLKNTDIFYLYNPFPRNILQTVVSEIEKARNDCEQGTFIWYAQPDKDCLDVMYNKDNWKCSYHKRSWGQDIFEFSLML